MSLYLMKGNTVRVGKVEVIKYKYRQWYNTVGAILNRPLHSFLIT